MANALTNLSSSILSKGGSNQVDVSALLSFVSNSEKLEEAKRQDARDQAIREGNAQVISEASTILSEGGGVQELYEALSRGSFDAGEFQQISGAMQSSLDSASNRERSEVLNTLTEAQTKNAEKTFDKIIQETINLRAQEVKTIEEIALVKERIESENLSQEHTRQMTAYYEQLTKNQAWYRREKDAQIDNIRSQIEARKAQTDQSSLSTKEASLLNNLYGSELFQEGQAWSNVSTVIDAFDYSRADSRERLTQEAHNFVLENGADAVVDLNGRLLPSFLNQVRDMGLPDHESREFVQNAYTLSAQLPKDTADSQRFKAFTEQTENILNWMTGTYTTTGLKPTEEEINQYVAEHELYPGTIAAAKSQFESFLTENGENPIVRSLVQKIDLSFGAANSATGQPSPGTVSKVLQGDAFSSNTVISQGELARYLYTHNLGGESNKDVPTSLINISSQLLEVVKATTGSSLGSLPNTVRAAITSTALNPLLLTGDEDSYGLNDGALSEFEKQVKAVYDQYRSTPNIDQSVSSYQDSVNNVLNARESLVQAAKSEANNLNAGGLSLKDLKEGANAIDAAFTQHSNTFKLFQQLTSGAGSVPTLLTQGPTAAIPGNPLQGMSIDSLERIAKTDETIGRYVSTYKAVQDLQEELAISPEPSIDLVQAFNKEAINLQKTYAEVAKRGVSYFLPKNDLGQTAFQNLNIPTTEGPFSLGPSLSAAVKTQASIRNIPENKLKVKPAHIGEKSYNEQLKVEGEQVPNDTLSKILPVIVESPNGVPTTYRNPRYSKSPEYLPKTDSFILESIKRLYKEGDRINTQNNARKIAQSLNNFGAVSAREDYLSTRSEFELALRDPSLYSEVSGTTPSGATVKSIMLIPTKGNNKAYRRLLEAAKQYSTATKHLEKAIGLDLE